MADQQRSTSPQSALGSGPTPAFPVVRSATIPATRVARGEVVADNWPLSVTQRSEGITEDGNRVQLGSSFEQAGPGQSRKVTGAFLSVDQDGDGVSDYSVRIGADGRSTITGVAARLSREEGLNIAQYITALTDGSATSGADMNQALALFRHAAGLTRK